MAKTPLKIDDKEPTSSRLRGIYMENFQSIKQPTYIEMNGLTFLYGPNSAGKSAIIDALSLWKRSVGAEKCDYNNSYLWGQHGAGKTKLGLSFIGRNLDETDGADVASWLEDEVSSSTPHIDFMNGTAGKLIQVEYSAELAILRIAVDNKPILDIFGLTPTSFNEDLSLALSDADLQDAEDNDRTFWGRVVVYKSSAEISSVLESTWSLINAVTKKKEFNFLVDQDWVRASYPCFPASNVIVSEEIDSYEVRGVALSTYRGKHARISVEPSVGLDNLLGKSKKDGESIETAIKSGLYGRIENITKELDLIVAGLCFQIRDLMSYSHVSGDRRTLSVKRPVYVSPDLGFLNIEDAAIIHPSVGQYAKFLATQPHQKVASKGNNDFVADSIRCLLRSLNGYKLKVSTLKVFDPEEEQLHYIHREIPEGIIVRMKIETPSGSVLGLDEVGSGISYILPILTSLWAADTSFIEQPELHLHPAAQCEVGDVLIAAASLGKNCVIESHSEHILLRVLRRIRETDSEINIPEELNLKPDQVAIYYFHPDGKGSTQVIRIRVDHRGELLTQWPGGFFSERDRELF
jgi:hypothetical protein